MGGFEIEYTVPYEGIHRESVPDRQGTVDWLRSNARAYEWSLDNVTVRGPVGEVDAYDLMRRAEVGEPLYPPCLEEAESGVLEILAAVRRQEVGQETLDAVERLRVLVEGLLPDNAPGPRP